MGFVRWTLDQVAEYLGLTIGETRELANAGYIHYARLAGADAEYFDAAALKEWRDGLGDRGDLGAAFLRDLLAQGVTRQHA
jgi:hypothetical protein